MSVNDFTADAMTRALRALHGDNFTARAARRRKTIVRSRPGTLAIDIASGATWSDAIREATQRGMFKVDDVELLCSECGHLRLNAAQASACCTMQGDECPACKREEKLRDIARNPDARD